MSHIIHRIINSPLRPLRDAPTKTFTLLHLLVEDGADCARKVPVKSDKSICPNEGSFVYKDDCRLFYKCKKDGEGKLNGFIYQCPEGFAYWSVSKRCEKTEKVPCENGKKSSGRPTLAPVETRNVGHK